MNDNEDPELWAEAREILVALSQSLGAPATSFRDMAEHKRPAEAEGLWQRWQRLRGQLALRNQHMASRIAWRVWRRIPRRATTCIEELQSMAQVGLLKAIDGFEVTTGAPFGPYCYLRVRGAIIDEIRGLDIVPASARRAARENGTADKLPQIVFGQDEMFAWTPAAERTDAANQIEKQMAVLRQTPDVILRHFATDLRPFVRMYFIERLTLEEIQERSGCCARTVSRQMTVMQTRLDKLAGLA